MAHELELQAKRLEEQHALQTSDRYRLYLISRLFYFSSRPCSIPYPDNMSFVCRLDCEAGSVAVYQTVKLEPASTGPQSTTSGSFSSAATMMKIPSKGTYAWPTHPVCKDALLDLFQTTLITLQRTHNCTQHCLVHVVQHTHMPVKSASCQGHRTVLIQLYTLGSRPFTCYSLQHYPDR